MPQGSNIEVIEALREPFERVGSVPVGGGGQAGFIEWTEVVHRLNDAVGIDRWTFELGDLKVVGDAATGYMICKGSLTVTFPDGTSSTKEQFGESAYGQGQGDRGMSPGNAAKAAGSDALKKCASYGFGVAFELAGTAGKSRGNQPRGNGQAPRNQQPQGNRPPANAPSPSNQGGDEDEFYCADCADEIMGGQFGDGREFTAQTAAGWGLRKHGRPLCGRCLGAANKAKEQANGSVPF